MTEPYRLEITGPGRNALGSTLMRDIIGQLARAGDRPVLLTGAGETFSAGLNLKEVAGLDRPGMERYLLLLDDVIDALYGYPGVTVAAVNGPAIAGGCVVALCCDVRIAASDPRTRIGLNEVPLGLEFPPKLLALARSRVPPRSLERVVLEGALHDPRAALALGLLDEIAPDAQTAARAALERLAASPRAEYVATKQALRRGLLDLSEAQRRYFREHIVPAWCAPAVKARVGAVLSRR